MVVLLQTVRDADCAPAGGTPEQAETGSSRRALARKPCVLLQATRNACAAPLLHASPARESELVRRLLTGPIMMPIYRLVPLLLALSCSVSGEIPAGGPQRAAPSPVYTADGRVLGVERASPDQPASYVQLVVQADGKTPLRVELAPGWVLDKHGLKFSEQDRVRVTGKTEVRGGNSVLVANRIEKGDQSLELRDASGQPVWEK
jgi:hypothetical protein